MRNYIVGCLLTVFIVLSLLTIDSWRTNQIQDNINPAPAETSQCEEDMPCWNCEIHGNRICGPVN